MNYSGKKKTPTAQGSRGHGGSMLPPRILSGILTNTAETEKLLLPHRVPTAVGTENQTVHPKILRLILRNGVPSQPIQ